LSRPLMAFTSAPVTKEQSRIRYFTCSRPTQKLDIQHRSTGVRFTII
jgi:hypothetical protein